MESRSACDLLRPSLVALVYGEYHPELDRLLDHLDACWDCRKEEEELRRMRDMVEGALSLPGPEAPLGQDAPLGPDVPAGEEVPLGPDVPLDADSSLEDFHTVGSSCGRGPGPAGASLSAAALSATHSGASRRVASLLGSVAAGAAALVVVVALLASWGRRDLSSKGGLSPDGAAGWPSLAGATLSAPGSSIEAARLEGRDLVGSLGGYWLHVRAGGACATESQGAACATRSKGPAGVMEPADSERALAEGQLFEAHRLDSSLARLSRDVRDLVALGERPW